LQLSDGGQEEEHASSGVDIILVLGATAPIDAPQVQQGKSSLGGFCCMVVFCG